MDECDNNKGHYRSKKSVKNYEHLGFLLRLRQPQKVPIMQQVTRGSQVSYSVNNLKSIFTIGEKISIRPMKWKVVQSEKSLETITFMHMEIILGLDIFISWKCIENLDVQNKQDLSVKDTALDVSRMMFVLKKQRRMDIMFLTKPTSKWP